jgi:hypothetical protein
LALITSLGSADVVINPWFDAQLINRVGSGQRPSLPSPLSLGCRGRGQQAEGEGSQRDSCVPVASTEISVVPKFLPLIVARVGYRGWIWPRLVYRCNVTRMAWPPLIAQAWHQCSKHRPRKKRGMNARRCSLSAARGKPGRHFLSFHLRRLPYPWHFIYGSRERTATMERPRLREFATQSRGTLTRLVDCIHSALSALRACGPVNRGKHPPLTAPANRQCLLQPCTGSKMLRKLDGIQHETTRHRLLRFSGSAFASN